MRAGCVFFYFATSCVLFGFFLLLGSNFFLRCVCNECPVYFFFLSSTLGLCDVVMNDGCTRVELGVRDVLEDIQVGEASVGRIFGRCVCVFGWWFPEG